MYQIERTFDLTLIRSGPPNAPRPDLEVLQPLHSNDRRIVADFTGRRLVTSTGRSARISKTMFSIVCYLASAAPRFVTSEELIELLHCGDSDGGATWAQGSLRVLMHRTKDRLADVNLKIEGGHPGFQLRPLDKR